jgi:hypothetical protein
VTAGLDVRSGPAVGVVVVAEGTDATDADVSVRGESDPVPTEPEEWLAGFALRVPAARRPDAPAAR